MDHPFLDHEGQAQPTSEAPPIPLRYREPLEILRVVAVAYSLRVEDITGPSKHKSISEARCVAYWLLRTRTRMSLQDIGRLLQKDHTSVMAGVRKCGRLRESDDSIRQFTDALAAAAEARTQGVVG